MKKKLNNDGGENDVFNFLPSVAIDFFFFILQGQINIVY